MSDKSTEERIMEVADLIQLSAEAQALLNQAQININLENLKVWYFKNYVTIGSGFVVEYIAYLNREKEKNLAQQSMAIEEESRRINLENN